MSQAEIAALFQTTPQNITLHIRLSPPPIKKARSGDLALFIGGGESRTLVLGQLCINDYTLIVFCFAVVSVGRRPTRKQLAPCYLESLFQKA